MLPEAHLPEGLCSTLAVELNWLLQRQQTLSTWRGKERARLLVEIRHFRSKLIDPIGAKADSEAKTVLSSYAYKKFFKDTWARAARLDFTTVGGLTYVYEKTVEFNQSEPGSTHGCYKIVSGDRCPCSWRCKWMVQCQHEMALSSSFSEGNYDCRWYNNIYFPQWVEKYEVDAHEPMHQFDLYDVASESDESDGEIEVNVGPLMNDEGDTVELSHYQMVQRMLVTIHGMMRT